MEKQKMIELVVRAQKGDDQALNDLFNSYYNDVYYFAYKTVKDTDLACDITQETFVEVINTLPTLRDPSVFQPWLRGITYHQCTRYFKKKKDVLVIEEEDGSSIFDTVQEERTEFIPDQALDQQDFRNTIMAMVDSLSEEQRAAVMMYYFDELPVKTIAQIQGVTESAVKSRLAYARKAIKASVEDYEKKNNVRLHSLAILPLLLWLFSGSYQPMSPTAVTTVASGVSASSGVSITAGNGAAGTTTATAVKVGAAAAKNAGKLSAIKVIAASVAAATVITTASIGISIASNDRDNDRKQQSTQSERNEIVDAEETARLYYQYIAEELLGKDETALGKLAKTKELTVPYEHGLICDISAAGGTGIISAIAQDFDSDGQLELLLISGEYANILDTRWKYASALPGESVNIDSAFRTYLLRGYLYDSEDGVVSRTSLKDLTFFPDGIRQDYARMLVGLEKIEDTYYLYACASCDTSYSFDFNCCTVTAIDKDGMRLIDHNNMTFHKIQPSNVKELIGLTDPVDMTYSSLGELKMPCYRQSTAQDAKDSLGNRLLCYVTLDNAWSGPSEFQVTDFTNLRGYLDNGAVDWSMINLPDGYFTEPPAEEELIGKIFTELEAEAGVKFKDMSSSVNENVYTQGAYTSDGTYLSVSYDMSTRQITRFYIYSGGNAENNNWNDLKMAILDRPEHGLTQDQVASFKGKPNWNNYQGTVIGYWTLKEFAAGSGSTFMLEKN